MKKQTSTLHRMLPALVSGKAGKSNVGLSHQWITGIYAVKCNSIFAITLITSIYVYGWL